MTDKDVAVLEAQAIAGAAEHLERFKKLPLFSFYPNTGPTRIAPECDSPVISIWRGCTGYMPVNTVLTAEQLNRRQGVTPEEAEAMLCGSIFGWDVPGADPDCYKKG